MHLRRQEASHAAVLQAQGQAASEDQLAFQPAAKYAPVMDAVHDALCQR